MPTHHLSDADEVLARKLVGETLCNLQTARKFVRGEPIRGTVLNARLKSARNRILAGQSEPSDALTGT